MLVIASDLHLTDGSSGETINAGAFRVFVEALASRVHDACWRNRGGGRQFVPIDRCDLVLLGDVFDVIRSKSWLESGALRPWSPASEMDGLVSKITDGILAHNRQALAHLRDLGGAIRIHSDRPDEHIEIPLHIHYFVGNHDWFYHLRGAEYDRARQKLVDGLGLDNDPKAPFPHMLDEASGDLQELLHAHRLYVQHGDIYDPFNYEEQHGRDHSSLGDCIVVELLNRFPHEVQNALGRDEDDALVRALREIDNVRPLLAIPRWIDGILRRQATAPVRRQVMQVWDQQVDNFLELPFVRARDRAFRWDTVDLLQVALRISATVRISALARFSEELERLSKGESLAQHAVAEDALRTRAADFVVYGHTHWPETVPIDVLDVRRYL